MSDVKNGECLTVIRYRGNISTRRSTVQNNARSVIMAVLLSTARVIKVSALYLFLPFLFSSSVTRELTTVFEYLRNIIFQDNTIGPYKKYLRNTAFQRNNLLVGGGLRQNV